MDQTYVLLMKKHHSIMIQLKFQILLKDLKQINVQFLVSKLLKIKMVTHSILLQIKKMKSNISYQEHSMQLPKALKIKTIKLLKKD